MTKREFYDKLEQSAFIDNLDNCCRIETNLTSLINQIFDNHEAIIKAKDEEIIKLYNKFGEANEKSVRDGYALGIKKARSIVAMLFWEWKKSQRWAGKNHFASKGNEDAFKKAYKILKDKA